MSTANQNESRFKSDTAPEITPDEAKFVPIEAFNIEKNEKNRSFFFILLSGLYKDFVEFDRNYCSADPNQDCVEYLLFNS